MIDRPDRPEPRFPPDKEQSARAAIGAALDLLGARPGDIGICGGACGGDILFAELCVARGMELRICIPQEVAEFIDVSVGFAGPGWVERFQRLTAHRNTQVTVTARLPDASHDNADPYERNNAFMLRMARGAGKNRMALIALWDGKTGDGPGGTAHMIATVRQAGGQVRVIATSSL